MGLKNYNLRIIKPGEFVGLSAVFSENTFNYSSVAITDCQVFLVEKEAIAKVIKQNGMFGFNIIKRYCEQNTNLLNTVSEPYVQTDEWTGWQIPYYILIV